MIKENCSFNAFALPRRKIGVFEGLCDVVANQDQLAGIMGHEIGHLEAAHSHRRTGTQLATGWGRRHSRRCRPSFESTV